MAVVLKSLAYLQYKVIDAEGKEIDLKEERDVNSSLTKSRTRAKDRDNDENNV